jgi:hypothetical protein
MADAPGRARDMLFRQQGLKRDQHIEFDQTEIHSLYNERKEVGVIVERVSRDDVCRCLIESVHPGSIVDPIPSLLAISLLGAWSKGVCISVVLPGATLSAAKENVQSVGSAVDPSQAPRRAGNEEATNANGKVGSQDRRRVLCFVGRLPTW